MKTEISSGGVVVYKGKTQWYVLLLKDMNDTWTFPKGLIEKAEKPEDAAIREIQEEVGITGLKLLTHLTPIQYFYQRNGKIKKIVHYFMFQSKIRPRPTVQKEEGIRSARWVGIDEAIGMVGYRETNVSLLEETQKAITQGLAL